MINSLLSLIHQEGSLSFGEACIYALIGFALVFAGIVLIICIIWIIGLIMRKTNNLAFLSKIKIKKKKQNVQPEDKQSDDGGEISDEIKAAVIAAIMAYYYEEKPECEFKVRRIKRI